MSPHYKSAMFSLRLMGMHTSALTLDLARSEDQRSPLFGGDLEYYWGKGLDYAKLAMRNIVELPIGRENTELMLELHRRLRELSRCVVELEQQGFMNDGVFLTNKAQRANNEKEVRDE